MHWLASRDSCCPVPQIPVIQDLPVGYNLQDHIGTGGIVFTINKPISLVQTRYENIPSILKYAMFGSGKS